MKVLAKFLEIIHAMIGLFVFIPFITNNKSILYFYLYWQTFVYLGWILLENICILSIIQKNIDPEIKDEKNVTYEYICKTFNIDLKFETYDKFFWILNIASVLVLFFKLRFFIN